MIYSDLELMELQAEALFTYNADGRMLRTNEPDGEPAPRFFLGRTKQGNVWRVRHDLSAEMIRELERMAQAEPITEDVSLPPVGAADIMAVLEGTPGGEERYFGPAFYVPAQIPHVPGSSLITEENAHLLRSGFPYAPGPSDPGWHAAQPTAAVFHEGVAVSICFCSRQTARAAEAGLETREGYRGRGYATAAVARWAHAVREKGLVPLYSTTWDNRASRAVANKLGCMLYGSDWSV